MDSHLADLVDSAPQDLKVHLVSLVQEGSGEPKTDHLLVVVLQDLVALGLTVLSEAVEVVGGVVGEAEVVQMVPLGVVLIWDLEEGEDQEVEEVVLVAQQVYRDEHIFDLWYH